MDSKPTMIAALAAVGIFCAGVTAGANPAHAEGSTNGSANGRDAAFRGTVQAKGEKTPGSDDRVIGFVFEDLNRDGIFQFNSEPGIPGVLVSNGRDVVKTNDNGHYNLPNIYDNGPNPTKPEAMTVFITKPDGYAVPLDEDNVPQFFYHHIPDGSPANVRGEEFRFGGLPASGPLPFRLNFPLVKNHEDDQFKVAVSGDTQTYSNAELGYFRDTTVKEWAAIPDLAAVIIEGDVMGDDLSLYTRFKEVVSAANAPQYYVPGNHDFDFDAPTDANSFDTFKREWGPAYYSFDIGDVHFVVLDDVRYPCTPELDNQDGLHGDGDQCDTPDTNPTYNGVITDQQIEWLKNDLAHVPNDKLVVLNMHIPIVSFIDQNIARQMVDNQAELYETVGCERAADGSFPPEFCKRPLLALAGHTHTNEQIRPGESFEGWAETLDSGALPPGRSVPASPFPQIIVGASAGSWWSGDFDASVVPESWQRLGAPRGYYVFEFDGNTYQDTFKATGFAAEKQVGIDLLTPEFVEWFRALKDWRNSNPAADAVPPANINDLPDTKQVLVGQVGETYLSVNAWNGSKEAVITVSFDGGEPIEMQRTQAGEGENMLETLDPFALKRQMMVARHAYATDGDEPRANGFELFQGSQQCGEEAPCTPRPMSDFFQTDQSSHVWQVKLPTYLELGVHTAKVTFTDHFGRVFEDSIVFEVVDERGFPFWNEANFEARP